MRFVKHCIQRLRRLFHGFVSFLSITPSLALSSQFSNGSGKCYDLSRYENARRLWWKESEELEGFNWPLYDYGCSGSGNRFIDLPHVLEFQCGIIYLRIVRSFGNELSIAPNKMWMFSVTSKQRFSSRSSGDLRIRVLQPTFQKQASN